MVCLFKHQCIKNFPNRWARILSPNIHWFDRLLCKKKNQNDTKLPWQQCQNAMATKFGIFFSIDYQNMQNSQTFNNRRIYLTQSKVLKAYKIYDTNMISKQSKHSRDL